MKFWSDQKMFPWSKIQESEKDLIPDWSVNPYFPANMDTNIWQSSDILISVTPGQHVSTKVRN